MMNQKVKHELDARGLLCPEPVMMLHKVMRQLQGGELLSVYATDPSTQRDVPKFCQFLGHTLEQQNQDNSEFYFLIRKKL